MESLGLSQKDVQSRNKWRRRIKGQPANPGSPGKMAVETDCVCVCAIKYTDGTSVVDTGVIFVYCAWHSSALIYLHTI